MLQSIKKQEADRGEGSEQGTKIGEPDLVVLHSCVECATRASQWYMPFRNPSLSNESVIESRRRCCSFPDSSEGETQSSSWNESDPSSAVLGFSSPISTWC